jgi:hypothetical protein
VQVPLYVPVTPVTFVVVMAAVLNQKTQTSVTIIMVIKVTNRLVLVANERV